MEEHHLQNGIQKLRWINIALNQPLQNKITKSGRNKNQQGSAQLEGDSWNTRLNKFNKPIFKFPSSSDSRLFQAKI